jgi:NAD(P)-dependent dehydrogenase (short-subunit alcohol dehydrogenase family)
MSSNSLHAKKVIIIGGSSGMGLAIAKHAHAAGAFITIASRNEKKLQGAVSEIGTGTQAVVLDTTSETSIASVFAALGTIDHLIIPGSSVRSGSLRDMPIEDGLFTMQSKFWGPYLCAKHSRIHPTGSITLFSGILSRRPGKNDAVLAPVNAAVEALGRALAKDLAPVRVNVISPGMTAGTSAYLAMPATAREGMYQSIASHLPVGRVGTPDDIATATLMLMTNGFITGVVLDVDGGGLISYLYANHLFSILSRTNQLLSPGPEFCSGDLPHHDFAQPLAAGASDGSPALRELQQTRGQHLKRKPALRPPGQSHSTPGQTRRGMG